VLVLRQAGRGRAAAGRRAGRAHLRRVHRAVQRDPRRGLGRRYRRGWRVLPPRRRAVLARPVGRG
jgi:hypothetical protein